MLGARQYLCALLIWLPCLVWSQPVLHSVNVSWALDEPRVNQYFTCTAYYDDPTSEFSSYFWFYLTSDSTVTLVNQGSGTGNYRRYSVTEYNAIKGDDLSCAAQVTDTLGLASTVDYSDEVELVNSPPVIEGISLTPSDAGTDDTVSCAVSSVIDVDDGGHILLTLITLITLALHSIHNPLI